MGRAFVAVVPPESVLDAVAEVVGNVGAAPPGWRWTGREQWHLTLQFLGRVDDADRAVSALRGAVEAHAIFAAQLGGAGAFPSVRRAGAAWVGLTTGADALGELAGGVSAALRPLGYEREEDRFRPHLTVARTRGRDRRDARALVDAFDGSPLGERFSVDEVVLFESRTLPSGAEYTARARVPLAAVSRG
jgi:2'-5' RNA ligase